MLIQHEKQFIFVIAKGQKSQLISLFFQNDDNEFNRKWILGLGDAGGFFGIGQFSSSFVKILLRFR